MLQIAAPPQSVYEVKYVENILRIITSIEWKLFIVGASSHGTKVLNVTRPHCYVYLQNL